METQVNALISSISAIDERVEKLREIWGNYIHTIHSSSEFPASALANADTGRLRLVAAGARAYGEFKLKDGKGIISYGLVKMVDGEEVFEETAAIVFDEAGNVVSEPKEFENITDKNCARYFHLKAVDDLCKRTAGERSQ
jgi:hypothetical protein